MSVAAVVSAQMAAQREDVRNALKQLGREWSAAGDGERLHVYRRPARHRVGSLNASHPGEAPPLVREQVETMVGDL